MEEMPSLNMQVQRLNVAILTLDLSYSGPVIHSGEILITGKSHGNRLFDIKYVLRFSVQLLSAAFLILRRTE